MCAYTYLCFIAFTLTSYMATFDCEQNFPMTLYDALNVNEKKSVFFSPIGIKASLAAAAELATGKTKNEILKTIDTVNMSLLYQIGSSLKNDRIIYLNQNLNSSQINDTLSNAYSISKVRFGPTSTTKLINRYVSNATKKWVERILPNSLNKDTSSAKVNSLYFHSNWKTEFTSTVIRGFKKPMVHQYGDFMFANLTDLNAAVLQLEFQQNEAKMLVLQPNDNDLKRLAKQLLDVDLTKLNKRLKSTHMSLYFPIINEIKMSTSLKDTLVNMDMELAFTEKATFTKLMADDEDESLPYIKEIRHHTSFKCGRESARFVAVTGTQWDLNSSTQKCVCVEDENTLEFENPANVEEEVELVAMRKTAPHFYFEHKLFFALVHNDDVVFLGTVAREK